MIRFLASLALMAAPVFAVSSSEWLTWGYDQERTGWNQAETLLGKDNVARLELKWMAQLSTKPSEVVLSTMTAPLVAVVNGRRGPRTLVFVVGSDDRGITAQERSTPITNAVLYALDGETGKELYSSDKLIDSWTHFSEPVVAGGQIYVSTWDGRLYAFGLKK